MENGVVIAGDSWLLAHIDRNSRGIEVFIRTDQKVEEFIQSLAETKLEKLSEYGSNWQSVPADDALEVYQLTRDLSGPTYSFGNVGGPLINTKTKQVNLTFLQIRGVGGGGIKFQIAGPFGRDYVEDLSRNILKAGREFIRNYIVPVSIRLTISSKEF